MVTIYEAWCGECAIVQDVWLRAEEHWEDQLCPDCGVKMRRKYSATTFFMDEKARFQRKVRANREAARARGEWGASLENDHNDGIDPLA